MQVWAASTNNNAGLSDSRRWAFGLLARSTAGGDLSWRTIASYPWRRLLVTEAKPDNNGGNRIGRIIPAGEVYEFLLPLDGVNPIE